MKLITTSFLVLLALLNIVPINSQTVENNSKVVMSEDDITSLARTLKKYKKAKSDLTENTHLKQASQPDKSYEIEYLRYRLTQLENQQNNAEVNRNSNQDNDNEIRAMQNEILQLDSLLNNQKLSSEINNPNVATTDSKVPVYAKNDEVKTAYNERFNQPSNTEVYRKNNQENDYKIRAMQNEISQLQSLMNKQKLSSETERTRVVTSDSDNSVSPKNNEVKIVYVDKIKNKEQDSVLQHKIDSLTFALSTMQINETKLLNSDFDSIQKKLSDVKNTINIKNKLPIKSELSTTDYVNYKKQLFFESSKKELDLNQITILDELVQILSKNDNIDVFIKGFASNKGNPVYNENLSLQRTESVKKALVSKGIHPTRILTQYHGIDYASVTNELARRVDIVLLIRK